MAKIKDCLPGSTVGRLTVIELLNIPNPKGVSVKWAKCVCSCGKEHTARVASMGRKTVSCGCLMKENSAKSIRITGQKNATHGMSRTNTYKSWKAMWFRTTNKKFSQYEAYKDRVPPIEWKKFENFLADVGEAPDGFTLERVDNSKGYGPDNCKWIPKTEQPKNRKSVRKFKYRGVEYTLPELANAFNKSVGAIDSAVRRGKHLCDLLSISEEDLQELPRRQ